MLFLVMKSVSLTIPIEFTVLRFGFWQCSLMERRLILERNKRTSGWTLESCSFTGLTLSPFKGKIMVVVGRAEPEP